MNLIFFGSFQHYSAMILQSLITDHRFMITGVVTTPPALVGRKQILTKTPVHLLAEQHGIPVFTPEKLTAKTVFAVKDSLSCSPDLFLTAGYGKILPQSWLDYPKLDCVNLHFSLLPKYRGANPAEWAIMCGETVTGISLIQMNQQLDGGDILAQAELPIDPADTRETLYQKLYQLGVDRLPQWLLEWQEFAARSRTPLAGVEHRQITVRKQPTSPTPYAALLKRDDGFLPWSTIQKFLQNQKIIPTDFPSPHLQTALSFLLSKSTDNQIFQRAAGPHEVGASTAKISVIEDFINLLPRALANYPSLWTIVPTPKGDKRMKILSFDPFLVQLEGQSPATFNQIKNTII